MVEIRATVKECVGCGFCCLKGICAPGYIRARKYDGQKIERCPFLWWGHDDGRYWCGLIGEDERFNVVLSIGAGCSCGLNTWRDNVRERG